MTWSMKYKRSIDCNNPKGFSQRAHCQGRKKKIEEQSDTPAHNEFKKAMGVGSYGDFVKKHGVSKTRTVVSSLKKERDTLRSHKQEWAGPKHLQNHDLAIRGLQRAIGEDAPVNAVGGGSVAGLGVGPQGEPGVKLRNKKKVMPFAVFARTQSK